MSDINSFKQTINSLIQKFDKDEHHYLSKEYLEAQVRQGFINPFFEALGWDIENRKSLSPFDREGKRCLIYFWRKEKKPEDDYNL